MRKSLLFAASLFAFGSGSFAQEYVPSKENIAARQQFQDNKYGMFIHWGLSSMLADGEWVMNNRDIRVEDYKRLLHAFYPADFSAAQWVSTARNAGMKYIVFITRHHDGFSNWDTKYSDWKITNTPYGKDVLRQLADECKKQGIKLGLYYSTLDWSREDYPHETGRTGQKAGRSEKGDYASYLQFMKNQLTELLTNYGDIMSIWFDGHWDQTNPEGSEDRTSRIDWKYNEIYGLIHQLQPQCMIGNNHHLSPIPGEDFQMFERDLPGENKSGLSFQKASTEVPVETCETINGSWGYNITDRHFKTPTQVIRLLAGAAGRNTNLLLNVGPMPTGLIQREFVDSLAIAGKWMQQYGESIYGTRGGPIAPQPWGVSTRKDKRIFIHLFQAPTGRMILLPGFTEKVQSTRLMGTDKAVKVQSYKEGLIVSVDGVDIQGPDTVVELLLK
ncbi:alpha-L-fucosidase [Flavihumibacter petaseus]|uniref:alpha-L-fucosidase n=1 Tax=Flavihumibacter petaseus NBRC 106054 TaxID=1220578 RepID=A0A0E9MYN8_9BACT|nr:alpha-L-fucosidase [Flavihumibacter petaseus]GAO42704.1 putative glycosidase [Flavihumibacter petaseus NBRC 106054]